MHLIVGATGKLGGAVARQLLEQGEFVRALTREPARAEHLRQRGAQVMRADLRDPASLQAALVGVRTVTAAAHALLGRADNTMERVDLAGHRALIVAARAAGIDHFVYTSIAGARPDHPLDFWRAKAEIEQYLQRSGLSYTVLRPTAFMETHAHELLGEPFLKRGTALLFGRGETVRNFVSVEDVAQLAVRALHDPALRNSIIEVGGADNLTDRAVAALYAELSGRPLKLRRVPVSALRIVARLIRPLHPGISRVMRMSIQLDSGTLAGAFDPTPLRERYGFEPIRLRDWIRRTIVASGQ